MKIEITSDTGDVIRVWGHTLLEGVLDKAPPPLTVMDIGTGLGVVSTVFLSLEYDVTGISLGEGTSKNLSYDNYTHVKENLFDLDLPPVDIVWSGMMIEHMPNVNLFLEKCRRLTKPGGWFCIVAPSDETDVLVDGHLTFWTPAHLIYNLVIAGFDCSEALWYTEGRDLGLMVQRKDRPQVDLNYDRGDLEALAPYFPTPLVHRVTHPWLADNFEVDNEGSNTS